MRVLTPRVLTGSAALLVALACGAAPLAAQECNLPPTKVSMQLAFRPGTPNVATYVAREKGLYAHSNIELSVIDGTSSANTATNIDQGAVLFGESDMQSLIVGRSKGQKIKAVALLTEGTTQAWGTLDPAIRTPKHFEGRKVGVGSGTGDALLLPVLVRESGGDPSKINVINIAPGVYATSLLSGHVDIVPSYLDGTFVSNARVAREQGKELHAIAAAAHNLDIYRQILVTSERTIAANHCLVRAFVQATMMGLRHAMEHPREAEMIVVKAVPTVNAADVPIQLQNIAKVIDTPAFRDNGYGVVDAAKMEKTFKAIVAAFDISGTEQASDIYTNEFLRR